MYGKPSKTTLDIWIDVLIYIILHFNTFIPNTQIFNPISWGTNIQYGMKVLTNYKINIRPVLELNQTINIITKGRRTNSYYNANSTNCPVRR